MKTVFSDVTVTETRKLEKFEIHLLCAPGNILKTFNFKALITLYNES